MSSSFEKSVKGGTKIKAAPPKSKYVEHILVATHSGEAGVAEVFRTLKERLRDSTWTIVFKSLIIVHLMIKEGEKDVTLSYLSEAPKNRLAINTFTDVQTQGQNIRRYSNYLVARAQGFATTHVDYARSGTSRMKTLSVEKGLLRETGCIQDQIKALMKCDLLGTEQENEISLTAFRLLTKDLLDLFAVMNEAVMNMLSHYFELSKPDAEHAISIYKTFAKQTDQVIQYLGVARQYEHVTKLEIPKIKHAPTSLAASLQEYIDDNDFETNRRQYLAEQQVKDSPKFGSLSNKKFTAPAVKAPQSDTRQFSSSSKPPADVSTIKQQAGVSAPEIDFFNSIEQPSQPVAQAPPVQQFSQPAVQGFPEQGYAQQPVNGMQTSTNPFGQVQSPPQFQQPQQLQPDFTGAGFGGFGPQQPQQTGFASSNPFGTQQAPQIAPSMQQGFAQSFDQSFDQSFGAQQQQQQQQQQIPPQIQQFQQQQMQPPLTNPFRQSMMITGQPTGFSAQQQQPQQQQQQQQQQQPQQQQPQQQQSTNPFARAPPPQQQINAFGQQPSPPQLASQPTGTNPFARQAASAQQQQQTGSPANFLTPAVTGSTNPFRQSAFVNQQTGTGWQNAGQGTIGGWEQLETTPIFPRPGQS